MPTYRSINIKLHSQFDIEAYPEYIPRSQGHYLTRGLTPPENAPIFDDEQNSACNVYIPVYPNSQFWLSYAVLPPVPEDQLFLFKLYINGAHIVSWSTGKEERWMGKTMFALYEMEGEEGRKRVEKRILCFTPPEDGAWGDVEDVWDEEACLEIKVYRAQGRKRIERMVAPYEETVHGMRERGIRLTSAGRAGPEHPKRFYKFTLIDPVDKPFATFRYYYRTWAQIDELGLSEDVVEDGELNDLSVIEPGDTGSIQAMDTDIQGIMRRESDELLHSPEDSADDSQSNNSQTDFHTGSPRKRTTGLRKRPADVARAPSRLDKSGITTQYRLSVPPSYKFDPPELSPQAIPIVPPKQSAAQIEDPDHQHRPVYPMDDWERRTPSPVQSMRETISTPTMIRKTKRGRTPSGWLSAIGNAWRRRGTFSHASSDDGSRAASRSDSRGVR